MLRIILLDSLRLYVGDNGNTYRTLPPRILLRSCAVLLLSFVLQSNSPQGGFGAAVGKNKDLVNR